MGWGQWDRQWHRHRTVRGLETACSTHKWLTLRGGTHTGVSVSDTECGKSVSAGEATTGGIYRPHTSTGSMSEGGEPAPGDARTMTFGALYALLITVLGFLLPVIFFVEGEGSDNGLYLAVFHIYIYTVSLFFLLYLQCCLMTKRRRKALDRTDSVDFDALDEDNQYKAHGCAGDADTMAIRGGGTDTHPLEDELDDPQSEEAPAFAFTGDGVNFFFRFGLILLGMGSVVLDGFRLLQFVESPVTTWLCYGNFFLVDTVMRLVFVFAETFFIFKNHKLVVNFKKAFVSFGLVHLVATNLCMWATVVVMETTEAYKLLQQDETESLKGAPVVLPTLGPDGMIQGPVYMNITIQVHRLCHGKFTLADKAAPYLYPAAIQFCLFAAAILIKIFANVGTAIYRLPHVPPQRSNSVCHKANTGLFLGLIVFVMTCIVTCFYLLDRAGHLPLETYITTLVFFGNDLAVLLISLLVVLVAFCKVKGLRVEKSSNSFNQILLFLGVTGYYGFYVCVLVPAIGSVFVINGMEGLSSQLLVVVCGLAGLQATAQVTFIVDTLRRHAGSRQQLKRKPGRSLITFLLITNLAMWIIDSFQLKELHTSPMLRRYYGDLAWQILIHLFLPLAVMFRFHSAVCFGDIWGKAYKKRPGMQTHNASFTYSDIDEHNRIQQIG